ncbi:hypothetical protein Tco_0687043 [Tanacetum coccineum]
MVSTMTTANAGRRTAATRGRGTSKQNGREGERSGDQAGSGYGTLNNGSRWSVFIQGVMACNLKDYDGKGGAIVYTRWIKKMESVQDMSGCGEN